MTTALKKQPANVWNRQVEKLSQAKQKPALALTLSEAYPRVTSFDALKQSTDICAHRITFSSRKFIILNKLSCFQSKRTFWEVREHLFCLKYRCQRVYVCRHHYFDRHQFRRLYWLLKKTMFSLQPSVHRVYFVLYKNDHQIISSS